MNTINLVGKIIRSQGIEAEIREVVSAVNYGRSAGHNSELENDWYIEGVDQYGSHFYWKQGIDGGELIDPKADDEIHLMVGSGSSVHLADPFWLKRYDSLKAACGASGAGGGNRGYDLDVHRTDDPVTCKNCINKINRRNARSS